MATKVTLRYAGTDFWLHVVFLGDNGHYYKTANIPNPDGGFPMAKPDVKKIILDDLHTSVPYDDFDGEPGWPVDIENFSVAIE